MNPIVLRFYAELNDFLDPGNKFKPIQRELSSPMPIGDVIAQYGIPASQIDLVLINGQSVRLSTIVNPGDRISIYPVFETFDISSLGGIHPEPLRRPRFIADVHLGKLATFLRLFGFDTLYERGYVDDELASISLYEKRTLLTRDRSLLTERDVPRGYLVKETNPRKQIAEVMERFQLSGQATPFTRCLHCNDLLVSVPKSEIEHCLPPRVKEAYQEFVRCSSCDRIYWKGTHYERMQQFISQLLAGA